MEIQSFLVQLKFGENKIATELIIETAFSKEIRILMKAGQLMKEHKAPFPIIVHILQGRIDFGLEGVKHTLVQGDIITLAAHVPHDLMALEDSIVRLTLSKGDKTTRVETVADTQ